MGGSHLDKLGTLAHAHKQRDILMHLILLVSSDVVLNLRSEQEYTLPVTMAAAWGDCNHTISGGSWEISLGRKSSPEKQQRKTEGGKGGRGQVEGEKRAKQSEWRGRKN